MVISDVPRLLSGIPSWAADQILLIHDGSLHSLWCCQRDYYFDPAGMLIPLFFSPALSVSICACCSWMARSNKGIISM